MKNVSRICLGLSLMMIAPSAMILTGCTKPRPATFAQNQGADLQEVAALDGKIFDLYAEKSIGSVETHKADLMTKGEKANAAKVETFSLVKFKTDAKLLKEIPFLGKPGKKYQIQYRLTDKFLKIYKIAPASELSIREKTHAEKLEDGRLAVALMGYPVQYFTVDRAQNDIGEATSKMIEVGQDAKSKGTHFKINLNNYVIFKALEKIDVIPASMFEGEWYFSETIISTPEHAVEEIGQSVSGDQNLENANRIKFLKYESFLKAVNVNIDDRLKAEGQAQGSDVNYAAVMSIPVKWKDYRLAKSGSDTDLSEEENNDLAWDKRPYVEMDSGAISTHLLSSAQLTNTDNKGNASTTSFGLNLPNKLVNFEISDNYISFTIQMHKYNARIRYSFMKAGDRGYQPKVHFEKDFKKFGYFSTRKASIQNYEIRRKEDEEKYNYISRFNPAKKEIKFHFTTTSPQWARIAAEQAVDGWNKAFAEAGTGMNVVLDKDQDVELGDLRYNAINLIESRVSGSLFGFGPSVTDPMTGEIISATSNVHITPIRSALDEEITNYVRFKVGEMNGSFVGSIATLVKEVKNTVIGQTSDGGLSINTSYGRKMPEFSIPVMENGNLVQKKVRIKTEMTNFGREFDLGLNSGNIHKEIETQCPEVLAYIEDVKAEMKRSGRTYTEKQNEIQDQCSKKLVLHKMLGTLIHEMGHNLGLRHNFMGSVDSINFLDPKVRSSSVMEYPAFNEDRLTSPGKYDVAAIRYGYADAVEADNGAIIKLDPKKTIENSLGSQKLKKYLFCTDEDVFFNTDPMCQRHDAGLTPEEVVDSMIKDYNASFATLNYRYDKTWSPDANRLAGYRLFRFYLPMKRFHDEWRSALARYLGINNRYLENYSQAQLEKEIEKMKKDPNFGYYAEHYRAAADKAYAFLKQIALMPSKYCLAKYKDGVDLVDFESIRETIFFSTNQSVKSCTDDHVKTYLARTSEGADSIGSVGYYLNSVKFDMNPQNIVEPDDVVGTFMDRVYANLILTMRLNTAPMSSMSFDFAPNFLDEVKNRTDWTEAVETRLFDGIDVATLKTNVTLAQEKNLATVMRKKTAAFPKFKTEQVLIRNMYLTLMDAVYVPGNPSASARNTAPYEAAITANPSVAKEAVDKIPLSGGRYFVVLDESASSAKELIQTLAQLQALTSAQNVTMKDMEPILFMFKDILPKRFEKMTAKQFVNLLLELTRIQELNKTDQTLLKFVRFAFEKERRVGMFMSAKVIEKSGMLDPEGMFKAMEELDLDAIYAEMKIENDLSEQRLKSDAEKYVNANQVLMNKYQRNKYEFDAQKTLILKIMMSFPEI